MAERQAVLSGQNRKVLAEIILKNEDPAQAPLYDSVCERIERQTGFRPLKWQINTMIFLAGLKTLDTKLK